MTKDEQDGLREAYCETLRAEYAEKYRQLREEFDRQLLARDERIRELEQRIARQTLTVHERQESWHAMAEQLKTTLERLAEAEKAMTDAKIMLMSSWNAVHLGTLEDRALGFLKEYFAKHSAEKTESG